MFLVIAGGKFFVAQESIFFPAVIPAEAGIFSWIPASAGMTTEGGYTFLCSEKNLHRYRPELDSLLTENFQLIGS